MTFSASLSGSKPGASYSDEDKTALVALADAIKAKVDEFRSAHPDFSVGGSFYIPGEPSSRAL